MFPKLLSVPLVVLLLTPAPAAFAQTGVGIGTTAPDVSAALDIVSSTKGALLPRVASATAIATPATGLLVFQTGAPAGFYYNAGTPAAPSWQQIATAAGAAVTATNGLTKAGSSMGLGGTLTQATTIAQAGNAFSLTGGNVGIGTSSPVGLLTVQGKVFSGVVLDQQQTTTSNNRSGPTDGWQSFTVGVSGNLTRIDMSVSSPRGFSGVPGTLSVYAGEGTGGALLTTQAITYNEGFSFQPFTLITPVAVVAGQKYTYRFQTPSAIFGYADIAPNAYGGGTANPSILVGSWDYCFKTYVAPVQPTAVLTALTGGNVGIGSTTPSQRLEVAGQVFSSTGGFRFPDNTVQTTAATTTPATTASNGLTKTANNVVLGGTLAGATNIVQAGNSFSLTGGNVGVGIATPTQKLEVAGQVFSSSDGFRFPDNTVQTTAATTATGANFIQNQSTLQSGASFNIGGNGYVGGSVGIGTSSPTQKLEVAGGIKFTGVGNALTFPDGTTQTTAAATAVTASNGLTKSGNNVVLGGTLTATTTIAQGGNAFSLTGGNVGIGTSSPAGLLTVQSSGFASSGVDQQNPAALSVTNGGEHWQSFTAGTSGKLTQVDLLVESPTGVNGASGTLSIYAGQGTGGALLTSQTVVFNQVFNTFQQYPLNTQVTVVAGQQYTYRLQAAANTFWVYTGGNTYAAGQSSVSSTSDYGFKTYVASAITLAVLTAQASGNVGIGTSSPGASLDVTRGTGGGGTAQFHGTTRISHFNYSTAEDTYLRGGKATSNVLINDNGGNVGIGTNAPGAKLHVAGNVKIDGNNTLEFGAGVAGKEVNAGKIGYRAFSGDALDIIGAGSGGRLIRFYAENGASFNGPVNATGFGSSSDARFKQHIRPLGGALASVLALRGVRYDWNALGVQRGGKAGAEQVGLIAQELETLYPELVFTDADGYKAVNYAQLAPVLIEAIKELKTENDALKAGAATDHASLLTLQAQMARLLGEAVPAGSQARK